MIINLVITMMFNGLIVCGDSDTSDLTKESMTAMSGSGSGSCETGTPVDFYHNKLLATLQVLQNKEETVRVQAESLAVAEQRIAALTARATLLRQELDDKGHQLQCLRKSMNNKIEKTDVSVSMQTQEVENQKNVVTTLQNNLSVIEELYRECFYETAKQEELIDMLRKSYLDVRIMDKEKVDQIGKLQNVISTQKWSLEKYRDIAVEVDNLKMEITNFLNSSNNDSGMWERSEESLASEVGDDLHDIMGQLLQLRGLLTEDCTCGLEEQNRKLAQKNAEMQLEIDDLRQRLCELESLLQNKDSTDQHYKQLIDLKEKELQNIRRQLSMLDENARGPCTACETLQLQLKQTQVLLNDKTAEVAQAREQCHTHEIHLKNLKDELEKSDFIVKENCKIRACVSSLSRQVSERRERGRELQRARDHIAQLDASYTEKAEEAAELRAQLQEAATRGAALCERARRAAASVRRWARRVRDTHRQHEDRIKEQETLISSLQERLLASQNDTEIITCDERTCPTYTPERSLRSNLSARCVRNREITVSSGSETASCTKCPMTPRREVKKNMTRKEIASCSSAPVPPRRLFRKKSSPCANKLREAGVQQPVRCDAECGPSPVQCGPSRSQCGKSHTQCVPSHVQYGSSYTHCGPSHPKCGSTPERCDPSPEQCGPPPAHVRSRAHTGHVHVARIAREPSFTEELFSRVEQLGAALVDSQQRWSRNAR